MMEVKKNMENKKMGNIENGKMRKDREEKKGNQKAQVEDEWSAQEEGTEADEEAAGREEVDEPPVAGGARDRRCPRPRPRPCAEPWSRPLVATPGATVSFCSCFSGYISAACHTCHHCLHHNCSGDVLGFGLDQDDESQVCSFFAMILEHHVEA